MNALSTLRSHGLSAAHGICNGKKRAHPLFHHTPHTSLLGIACLMVKLRFPSGIAKQLWRYEWGCGGGARAPLQPLQTLWLSPVWTHGRFDQFNRETNHERRLGGWVARLPSHVAPPWLNRWQVPFLLSLHVGTCWRLTGATRRMEGVGHIMCKVRKLGPFDQLKLSQHIMPARPTPCYGLVILIRYRLRFAWSYPRVLFHFRHVPPLTQHSLRRGTWKEMKNKNSIG